MSTLKGEENLTGRVSFLRSKLVCILVQTFLKSEFPRIFKRLDVLSTPKIQQVFIYSAGRVRGSQKKARSAFTTVPIEVWEYNTLLHASSVG